MIFKSKVDAWLVAVVLIVCLLSTSVAPAIIQELPVVILFVGIDLWVILSLIYFIYGISYQVTDTSLEIKCRFIKYGVYDIRNIRNVVKTDSLLSAPAASFDRIELIFFDGSSIIVSPKDKSGFLKCLSEINPNVPEKL